MRDLLFLIFRKITTPFLGKGLGRISFFSQVYAAFFNILKPRKLILRRINFSEMWLDPMDTSLALPLLMTGVHEKGTTNVLKSLLKPGMIAVDVGANIGYYTLLAASLVGAQGEVHAFEPVLSNFELLTKSVQENNYRQVVVMQKAVSDKNGKVKVFLHRTGSGAHTMGNWDSSRKSTEVESVTLDSFFSGKGRIDFLKIDVEGFEPSVINGGEMTLKKNPLIVVLVEFWPEGIRKSGHSPEQFLEKLRSIFSNIYYVDDKKGTMEEMRDEKALLEIAQSRVSVNIFCSKKPII